MRARDAATSDNRGLVLLVMTAGYFLVLLDVTVINVTLPSIRSVLSAEVGALQWVVDGYAVALAALLLTGGTMGDLYGHRRVVFAGFALFGAASLACGLAPSTGVLIGARVVQGVGAAVLLPGTLAVINRAYRGDRGAQARAIGTWAAAGSLALPAGPLLGGLLVESAGWRGVFLVNLPVVVIAMAGVLLLVPEDQEPSRRGLDWPGAVLGSVFLATLTLAFIESGRTGFASSPVALATACAAAALAAFVFVEGKSRAPMLPLALFRVPGFVGANAVAGLMNLVVLGTIFLLTLYLQVVQGNSALVSGLKTVPLFAPLSVIAPLGGRLTSRFGPRVPMVGGLALGIVGLVLLGLLRADSAYLTGLLPPMLLLGAGLGLLTPAVVAGAMGSVSDERSGLASGINNTARQACGAVGVALFGALAGSPGAAGRFLSGVHAAAVIGTVLWACGIVIALTLVGFREDPD